VLVSSCATRPPERAPRRPWSERQSYLQSLQHFELSGRIGAHHGEQAFSAGVHWRQQGKDASVTLSGPLGIGGAQVREIDGNLQLTDGQGTLEGSAARERLSELIGFPPPLASLRYWVLGVNDPVAPAEQSLDQSQRLVRLRQGGWQVDYQAYTLVQDRWLPHRLSISRDDLALKLVINTWQLPAPQVAPPSQGAPRT